MKGAQIINYGPAPEVQPEPPRSLTVWRPDDLLAWSPPADSVILGEAGRGYLVREEITVLIGPPGVGKSRLILHGAVCGATGRPWLGHPMHGAPTRWLLIGNENSRARLKYDLERMLRALTEPEQAAVRENLRLHVLAEPRDAMLDLGDQQCREAIGATLREHRPDVVAFDPWANMVGGDENKNQDVRDSVRHLMKLLREDAPRAAAIVAHHARTGGGTVAQAGNRYAGASLSRGGKALPSAARCEIAVWPGDSEDGARLVVTCEKSNNAPIFAPRGLMLDPETMLYHADPDFELAAWKDDIEGKRRGQAVSVGDVVRVVRDACKMQGQTIKRGQIVERLRDETGASQRTIQSRITEAKNGGYLRAREPAGHYSLGAKPHKQ